MGNKLGEKIIQDSIENLDLKIFLNVVNKTILITGASGLIGHYLVAYLSAAASKGLKVKKVYLVFKNRLPDYFDKIFKGLNVEFFQGDITEITFLNMLPKSDYIIHAAGYGQPGKFLLDELKTIQLNTTSTIEIFKKLKKYGSGVFISTSEIYSGLSNPPFVENQVGSTNTNHNRSCYIEGKRCGEAIVSAFRKNGYNLKSIRLSLAYGPGTREDDNRVINTFIRKGILQKKIEMLDSGAAFRTYIYVTDAVDLIYRILFFGESDIYNLGGKSRLKICDLALLIGKNLNVPIVSPKDDLLTLKGSPDDVFVDMSKAEIEFNRKNYVELDQGLSKTIDWQLNLYKK